MFRMPALIISSFLFLSFDVFAGLSDRGRGGDRIVPEDDVGWTWFVFYIGFFAVCFMYMAWEGRNDKKYQNDTCTVSSSSGSQFQYQHGMPIAVIYITSLMLIIGAAPLPYGYYTLMKLVACCVYAWGVVVAYKNQFGILPWLCAIGVITFNPLIPIYMPREAWMFIDISAGLFLFFNRGSLQTMAYIQDDQNIEKSLSVNELKKGEIDIKEALILCNDYLNTDARSKCFYREDLSFIVELPAFIEISKSYKGDGMTGWGGLAFYCEATISTAIAFESRNDVDEGEMEFIRMHAAHTAFLLWAIIHLTQEDDLCSEDERVLLGAGPIGFAYLKSQS